MKSLSVKLGVVLSGLFIFTYGEVWGADWKLYGFNNYSLLYYDAQSITRPSKNIVRVWEKFTYTEKGVMDTVGSLGKKYEDLSHSINLDEINCIEKMIHSLSGTYYDNGGGVIYTFSSRSEWDFIIPESLGELLYKEICK